MSTPGDDVDVAIIGAGPAGTSAAIQLARAGLRTVVFERKAFPREKVCGGCLSGFATRRLSELAGPTRSLPGAPMRQFAFTIGDSCITWAMEGTTRMCQRSVLDRWLADLAADAGADFRFGVKAEVKRGTHGWEIVAGADGLHARIVLLACGLLGGQPRRLGITNGATGRRLVGQMWLQPALLPLPPMGQVEMHWLSGGYVGLASPAGQCVVAIAAEWPTRSGESAFEALRRRNPGAAIWDVLSDDAPHRWKAQGLGGFPWRPDRLGDENLLLVGDAAGFEEPYSGEGIGQAIRSADCAVQAILSGGDLVREYAARMHREHHRIMQRTATLRRWIDSPMAHWLAMHSWLLPDSLFVSMMKHIHLKGVS